jgi:hypothetical protein
VVLLKPLPYPPRIFKRRNIWLFVALIVVLRTLAIVLISQKRFYYPDTQVSLRTMKTDFLGRGNRHLSKSFQARVNIQNCSFHPAKCKYHLQDFRCAIRAWVPTLRCSDFIYLVFFSMEHRFPDNSCL